MESRPCLLNVDCLTQCVTSSNRLHFSELQVTLAMKGSEGPTHFPFLSGTSVLWLGSDMALQGPETLRPELPFHLAPGNLGHTPGGRSEHGFYSLFRGNAHTCLC